jgi:hypothetical protein
MLKPKMYPDFFHMHTKPYILFQLYFKIDPTWHGDVVLMY